MASSERKQQRVKRSKPRGQAMVEYSVVTHALLFFGGAAALPMYIEIMKGLNTFYESLYTVIEASV